MSVASRGSLEKLQYYVKLLEEDFRSRPRGRPSSSSGIDMRAHTHGQDTRA
jgi:hypothetical protein